MSESDKNYYKYCRDQKGFTQQYAAELLNISVETLSRYENGHTAVDDYMIEKMMVVYDTPALGFWYLRNVNRVGKICLAKSTCTILTNGDVAFQTIVQRDAHNENTELIVQVMADGRVDDHEVPVLAEWLSAEKMIVGQMLDNIAYVESLLRNRVSDGKSIEDLKSEMRRIQ